MALAFPDIDPVAFAVGPFEIRWYALAYLAGFLLGWKYALYLCGLADRTGRPTKIEIDDFIPWAIVGVILGGRLGYILFYQFDYYAAHPGEILKLWHGGMAFHGGALGVIAAMVAFSMYKKMPLLRLADIVVCTVPIGLFFGRIANFINGELYGRITTVPWGVEFPNGGEVARHPSQLYEAGLEGLVLFLILLGLVHIRTVRDKPGILAGVFLLGYGAFRAFVELFREPDAHLGYVWSALSMGQILSLPMVLAGVLLIGWAFAKRKAENSLSV